MISNFMPEVGYLNDDFLIETFGDCPEEVSSPDTQLMLESGKVKGIGRQGVHIMAQNDGLWSRILQEGRKKLKYISLINE
jgi:hypothetical protein